MEIQNQTKLINVEAIITRLLKRGTMTDRFRLPTTVEEAQQLIFAAIKGEVDYRKRNFDFNEDVKSQIRTFTEVLTSDHPSLGILLCGGVGNGKSTFMKAFQQILSQLKLPRVTYKGDWEMKIHDARELAHICKSDYPKWRELCDLGMLGIDDLGIEPLEIQDYGNIYCPMVDLLSYRYDKQLFTMVTTNLTPQEIGLKYGARVADRLNEMMAKIVFRNSSYRQ